MLEFRHGTDKWNCSATESPEELGRYRKGLCNDALSFYPDARRHDNTDSSVVWTTRTSVRMLTSALHKIIVGRTSLCRVEIMERL